MLADADLFRASLEYVGTVTPIQEILRRPDVARRILAAEALAGPPPIEIPGPNRHRLLELAR